MLNVFLFVLQGVDFVTTIQKSKNTKYTSPEAVIDMQQALNKVVDEELIDDLRHSLYFSCMLDESTDRSTEKTLMLYVRYIKQHISVTRFLSVVELSGGTADYIFEAVKQVFVAYELDFTKCISVSTDGASVMTGIRSRVTTLFKQQNPFIVTSHCIAHRLALGVSQAANSYNYLKKFQGTLNEIYKYYHFSCKHTASLKAMGVIFEKAEKKFVEVFATRWLSFEGAVGALLDNFDMMVSCLHDDETGNVIAGSLVKFMCTFEFLAVCHLMADIMGIVCRVSRTFQREDLTFTVVRETLDPACSAITGFKSAPGPRLESFLSKVPSNVEETGQFEFGGNVLKFTSSQKSRFESLKLEFIDKLVANLHNRFPSQEVFQGLSIFDPKLIPSSGSEELVSYGRSEVNYLCSHFGQDRGHIKALISEVHFREEWLMVKEVLAGYKDLQMDSVLSSL